MPVYLSIYLSIYLAVYPSILLSIYMSIYSSIYLYLCLILQPTPKNAGGGSEEGGERVSEASLLHHTAVGDFFLAARTR